MKYTKKEKKVFELEFSYGIKNMRHFDQEKKEGTKYRETNSKDTY